MYDTILDALRRGDAAQAETAAREVLAAQPQDATAFRLLASAQRMTGDNAAALASLDAALALAPEDADLHLERAGLLLAERRLPEADAALATSTGLDPNQFHAYIVQGHLAIARGDLDEAERVARNAARVAPEEPLLAGLEGTIALRRGQADQALLKLTSAIQRAPNEPMLRQALGVAHLSKGHYAFAEQAFRGLLGDSAEWIPLRSLVADLMRRQGRAADAADELRPLLKQADVPSTVARQVGELELNAGRAQNAVEPLLTAMRRMPQDRRTLSSLMQAWQRLGAIDEARASLDELLAATPQVIGLWRARLFFEPFAGETAEAVIQRWLQAMPDSIAALEAHATLLDTRGDSDAADAIAQRIVELEPGHTQAELRLIERLLARDPAAAVGRVQDLLARAPDELGKRLLRQLLGRAFDQTGEHAAAAACWSGLHADMSAHRLPLPTLVDADPGSLPELAPLPEDAKGVVLLWGAPGSLVERLAVTFEVAGAPLATDRYSATPPDDAFQKYETAAALAHGSLDPQALAATWRAQVAVRGRDNGNIIDWLVFWDNAYITALRQHVPDGLLLIALRDPRDMLLDWLAFGAPAQFQFAAPVTAAEWLAAMLAQIATLHERDLFPHRLIRLDEIVDDSASIAEALAAALETPVPAAPDGAFGPPHFTAGHWRRYADTLGDSFARLSDVAQRLGYPAA